MSSQATQNQNCWWHHLYLQHLGLRTYYKNAPGKNSFCYTVVLLDIVFLFNAQALGLTISKTACATMMCCWTIQPWVPCPRPRADSRLSLTTVRRSHCHGFALLCPTIQSTNQPKTNKPSNQPTTNYCHGFTLLCPTIQPTKNNTSPRCLHLHIFSDPCEPFHFRQISVIIYSHALVDLAPFYGNFGKVYMVSY